MSPRSPRFAWTRALRYLLCAVTAIAASAGSSSRADNLDVELMKQIEQVRDYLVKKNYRAVGVLSFRLQHGAGRPSFHGGMIIQALPERLETALIASLDPAKHPLQIAHNAAAEAGKQLPGANYRTVEERARLFTAEYPLAWGNPRPRVKLDAFITGKLVVAPDLKSLRVELEAFDHRSPETIQDMLKFTVPMDRYMLTDVGQGFSLSASNKGKFLRAATENDIVMDAYSRAGDSANSDDFAGSSNTAFSSLQNAKTQGLPIRLVLYYDGVEQSLTSNTSSSGLTNYDVRTPARGEKLEIGVINLTDERLGLALTVNGLNTLYKEKGEASTLQRWVLEPNKEYRVKGYYYESNDGYETIQALGEEESADRFADLGGDDKAGLIYAYVYRPASKSIVDPIVTKPTIPRLNDDEIAVDKSSSLADLQMLIVPGKFNKGLFAGLDDKKAEALQNTELGSVQLTDTFIIRYYAKPQ